MKTDKNGEPSDSGRLRSFYEIKDNGDGTVDIFFDTGSGFPEEDEDHSFRILKGIVPSEDLEEDIRRNFQKWYEIAEVIWL